MSKRVNRILCLCFVMMIALTGCQLAIKTAGEEQSPDRLIGVYITFDGIERFEQGAVKKIMGKVEPTDGTAMKVSFEGIEGLALMAPGIYQPDHNEYYITSIADPQFNDCQFAIGSAINLEGTIYFDTLLDSKGIFMNPVYQTSEGQIYLIGESTGVRYEAESGGPIVLTLNETFTETINGVASEITSDIKVTFKVINSNEKVIVKQMSETDTLLATTTILRSSIPNNISRDPGTAYFLIESHGVDAVGEYHITREIIESDETAIKCYFPQEDGIVLGTNTIIQ